MRKNNSLGNRLIALILSIMMVLGMIPAGAFAVEDETIYGTVEGLTDGVSIEQTGEHLHVVFAGALNWVAKDESIGRNQDGWWVGLKVTAPETINIESAKYLRGTQERVFKDYNDSADDAQVQYISFWSLVNEDYLRSANLTDGLSTYTWSFDWDGNGEYEQTLTLDIDADRTILYNAESNQIYPAPSVGYGKLDMLTAGATITDNESANISIAYEDALSIEWVAADPSIGRYQDGWWCGMKITVPAGMTEEQLKNVQYMSGKNLRSFWTNKDSKEGDAVHFMTMWIPLNNLLSDSMQPYTYQFDWNNDGIFEQSVVMTVDPSKVTLTMNGTQVYPVLGTVDAYQPADIQGSGTGETEVLITDCTLNWSDADESIGRTKGWWVGIKVNAPAGMEAATLQNATYQSKGNPNISWDDVTQVKSFWANKDSQDTDASHNIQLWFMISPASLEKFKSENRNITMVYRFNWDGQDDYEQQITFSVDPNGNIVLNKVDQSGFGFVVEEPKDIWVGDVYYTNVTVGGQGDGAITYEIVSGDAATIDADGMLTFTKAGTVTVKATKAADTEGFYNAATAQYTITAAKEDQYPKFEKTSPGVITYAPGLIFDNPIQDVLGGTVTYSIIDEDVNGTGVATIDSVTGKLTVIKAGTVTVKAVIDGDVNYNPAEASYTVVIQKADQSGFAFENAPAELTWQSAAVDALSVIGGNGNGAVTWTIIAGTDVATVDSVTGEITLLKAGTFTIQAVKDGDDCYNASEAITQNILVNPAAQSWTGFGETEQVTVTYNDNGNKFTLEATGGQSSENIVYTVIEGDAASVDALSGVVTLLKAGTVIIQAARPADDRYTEITDTYVLTIGHDDQEFTFAKGDSIDVNYGIKEYSNDVVFADHYSAVSELVYTVSENDIGAVIDATTGKLTFGDSQGKEGTITVTAAKAGDERYKDYELSYTLTVSYLEAPAEQCVLSGTKATPDSTSNWYVKDLKIVAPTGYEISYDNELISTTDWAEAQPYSEPGKTTAKVYLRRISDGAITDAINVDVWYDDSAAQNLAIDYKSSFAQVILQKIFLLTNGNMTVEFTAEDAESGIAKVEYSLDEGKNFTALEAKDGVYSVVIEAEMKDHLALRVTNGAGTVAEMLVDEKVLVIDKTQPEIAVVGYTGEYTQRGDILYTKDGNFAITFRVDDDNFSDIMNQSKDDVQKSWPVITMNGKQVDGLVWEDVDGHGEAILPLPNEGDYHIVVTASDRLNDAVPYEVVVHVDHTAPVIKPVTFTPGEVKGTVGDRVYFDADQTATIVIEDHNFDKEQVEITLSADGTQLNAAAHILTDWVSSGDTHTLALKLSADANYMLDVACTDIPGHTAVDYKADLFTVDHEEPKDLSISYSQHALDKVWEAISFGYFEAPRTVTLTASDLTAGIASFTVTATAEGPAAATDIVLPENLKIYIADKKLEGTSGFLTAEDVTITEENGTVSVSFEVPAQFRGTFAFTATDYSLLSNSQNNAQVQVVDTTAPGYSVSYKPANVVLVEGMVNMPGFDPEQGIVDINSEEAVRVMYFSGDAVATIRIDEANFDPADVQIQVLDAAGNALSNWQLSDWTTVEEAGKADAHTATVTVSGEGDYRIKVFYQDKSQNTPVEYLSQWIVIDETAPEIKVEYSYTDAENPEAVIKNTIDGRDYFKVSRNATITVTDHNFRADDVIVMVTVKDVQGNDLQETVSQTDDSAKSYADQGSARASWTVNDANAWRRTDDTYELTLTFPADANYTFDIAYKDLAQNDAVYVDGEEQLADYETDLFTVDATPPTALNISYSQNVADTILNKLFFGYYDAQMTVEISAQDNISGVHYFIYSYLLAENVSKVNAQAENIKIEPSKVEGDLYKATFKIPMEDLKATNQFNGSVNFTAYDRSENSEFKDDVGEVRIIVDSIAPTATISYNAPVQDANGTSYYDGNINATIAINEANFNSRDVIVSVTKNGASYPVNVAWRDNSVDSHTGTFTLTEDGDYVVSVQYTDKSGNQMRSYTSNELTLDTTKPVIKVSNIKANTANKDEQYGFVIEISDINLDIASMKPVLKAVQQTAAGVYETVQIDLGEATAVVNGQTYTYTVENLPDDGLYTLTCEAKDMSANAMSQLLLDDGASYAQVQFSINRNGSAFGYGDPFVEELVDKYYVYSVDEDIVIEEVNVDPIEDYKVSLNGKELTEGTDYSSEQTSNEGEWSKRTYIIHKSLFEDEGEYNIIVSSVDKAETTAFSDIKNLTLAFVVDQSKPVLTITGLAEGGRYQTEAQKVTLLPTDEGGRLNALRVVVLDSNGDPLKAEDGTDISVCFDKSGEELLQYLEANDGVVTFDIPKGLNNQISIICNDCAVNAEGLTNEYNELFQRVTVSPNRFVIFYANTPLFVGTIVGVLGVLALVIILIKRKSKKNNKEKAKA